MKIKRALPALLLIAGVLTVPASFAQHKSKAAAPAAPASAAATSPYMQVQEWKKGDRLPTEFRDRQYVIDDWKQYSLPAPRKGTHWVGVGANYYLVAPNGVIQQVGAGT
jgi:Ni/Co efflux regulator RcnB